jgi:DNA-binding response OmpR family regulator
MPLQTAMIIDDDADFGHLLESILEERKIYAMSVQTLQEAEDYLSYMKPTVIFLDNSFPDGLGINFIRTIRSSDDGIKIIMITGDTGEWIQAKAREEGIYCFLKKPLTKEIIYGVLDKLNFGATGKFFHSVNS